MSKEPNRRFHGVFLKAVKRGGYKSLSELARVTGFDETTVNRMAWGERLGSVDVVLPVVMRGKEGYQPGFPSQKEVFLLLELIKREVDAAKMERLLEVVREEIRRLNLPAQETEALAIIEELYHELNEQERALQATRQRLEQLEKLVKRSH